MREALWVYLAGPMTGLPQFNFGQFEVVSGILRAEGFNVVSPHESDPGHVQKIAWLSPDGDPSALPPDDGPLPTALRNVEGTFGCDLIGLLPNWHKSAGTRHEIETAHRFKIPVTPVELLIALGEEATFKTLQGFTDSIFTDAVAEVVAQKQEEYA